MAMNEPAAELWEQGCRIAGPVVWRTGDTHAPHEGTGLFVAFLDRTRFGDR